MAVAVEAVRTDPPMRPRLTVAAAIPKGDRAMDMVAALSQLGVDELAPLAAERSVVEPRAGKLERFERAAVESAKQCGRNHLMAVSPVATLAEVLARPFDQRLIAAKDGAALNVLSPAPQSALVLI